MGIDVSGERNLGLWGSVLALLGGFVPYLRSVLGLIGFVMVLMALKGISDKVGDDRPFRNYLFVFVSGVAVVVLILFLIFGSLSGLWRAEIHEETHWGAPGGSTSADYEMHVPLPIISGIVLLFILMVIVMAYFEIKTWEAMYEITGTREFGDAANWFKWGAVTSIVLVGLLLLFIARIFVILGFHSMPDELEEKGTTDFAIDSPIA